MSEHRQLPAAPPLPDPPPRPKKRQPTQDEITKARLKFLKEMSKHYITNEENIVAKEMFRLHKYNWPQILVVTAGCEGESDFVTFSSDEVLRVDREFNYQCVLARDRVGRIISIPLDFDIKCRVVSHDKASEKQFIANIIESHSLPVTVKFAVPDNHIFDLGESAHRADSFGCMALLKVYDETYLISNPLIDGVLDPHIIIIPLYLEMLISTVVGAEAMSVKEWEEYTEEVKKDAAKLDFSSVKGRKAMAIYPDIPDEAQDTDIYSYIRPDSYVILREKETGRIPKERINYCEIYKCDKDENVYEEITPSVPPRAPQKKPCSSKSAGPPIPKRDKSSTSTKLPPARSDVSDLTVAELGEKLKLLKLDKYVKKFEKEGIDGSILVEMDQLILKKEFHFKEFEAIKLTKFVQSGHIPS
ncbi:uncharacterized protein LOC121377762 [Gigantopelta aegis]|uniref:uncharacterized protein LOC121377762 n=1 Tax=Gigantopelta aegis TaxID=1735272 RepID=UPI001B889AE5|nr:uncharacterized protein LOC121377762 [Gigantopelta aegis]XP_041361788.1 uncharacterized protein LOC121377762 [Gigantopelta aegis]